MQLATTRRPAVQYLGGLRSERYGLFRVQMKVHLRSLLKLMEPFKRLGK